MRMQVVRVHCPVSGNLLARLQAGEAAVVPTVVVKSYAPEGADIARELAAIAAAHPWEIPVIEVGVVGLVG